MLALVPFLFAPLAAASPNPSPTDEASAAQSTDPVTECTAYSYAPVTAMLTGYPTVWHQPATIPTSDTVAQDLYNSFSSQIPNYPTRGTPTSVTSGETGYDSSDPDCWWTFSRCVTPKLAGIPLDVVKCPEPGTWGYTFDDGPNCSHNAFYDFMQTNNQKATLFYIGSNVVDWPLEAQRGLADGHEICAHTWSHPYMTALTSDEVFAELYYSKKAILDVLGVTVKCWRPPFGDVDDRVRFIANQLGMATIVWDQDTFDWDHATIGLPAVTQNYDNIIQAGSNGTYDSYGPIVLSHELDNVTMALAQQFYPQIKGAYKHVTPVNVCWNITNPYVETDISYPNFDQYVAGTTTMSIASASVGTANPTISAGGSAGPYTVMANPSGSAGSSSGSSGSSGNSPGGASSDNSAAVRTAAGMLFTVAGVAAGWGLVAGML